jgi:rod shape-determining protein MreC
MASEYGGSAESLLSRYRNALVLAGVLAAQFLLLAVQVRRPQDAAHPESGSVRLIRVWAVSLVSPLGHVLSATNHWARDLWSGYLDLRHVHDDNRALHEEIDRMKIEQARLRQEAADAGRLQALLEFRQRYVDRTVAAQVIGSSGSEQSRILYLDKGERAGIKRDMAVITPDGVVGKVIDVTPFTAQVLMITDQSSGVGAVIGTSRLHGIVRGSPNGEVIMHYVMKAEDVRKGEPILTSGGDRVFPKGLPIGQISDVIPGSDIFFDIHVRPAARLDRLDEVLVVTKIGETDGGDTEGSVSRASDVLAQRLPTVEPKADPTTTSGIGAAPAGGIANTPSANDRDESATSPKPGKEVTR